MIIDAHCHYNLDPLYDDWQEHWEKAQSHGLTLSLIVGTNLQTCQRALEIADTEPNLLPILGIHPHEATEIAIDDTVQALKKLLSQNNTVIALGETGLDYYWLDDDPDVRRTAIEAQHQLFRQQISLAETFRLPLVLHVRDRATPETPTRGNAYWDVLQLLDEAGVSVPFELHCISGPTAYLERALDMGAYVGVAANCMYNNAEQIRTLVEATPADRLMVETDAPYLPPQAFRGKICEPWMIEHTVAYLETELAVDPAQLYQNTQDFFDL